MSQRTQSIIAKISENHENVGPYQIYYPVRALVYVFCARQGGKSDVSPQYVGISHTASPEAMSAARLRPISGNPHIAYFSFQAAVSDTGRIVI